MQFTPVTPNVAIAAGSGESRRDCFSTRQRHDDVRRAVVVQLYRQLGSADGEHPEERVGLIDLADSRHRLLHPPEYEAARLVAVELDRDHAHPGLELDHAAL